MRDYGAFNHRRPRGSRRSVSKRLTVAFTSALSTAWVSFELRCHTTASLWPKIAVSVVEVAYEFWESR